MQNSSKIEKLLFVLCVIGIVSIGSLNTHTNSKSKELEFEDRINRIALSAIDNALNEKYRNCLRNNDESIIIESFILAILAVENYGRPPLRRWIEEKIAKIEFYLFRQVPNYSFGVGQVRLNTARRVLSSNEICQDLSNLTDDVILGNLLDTCQNINTVTRYISSLMIEQNTSLLDSLSASIILTTYNGQSISSYESNFYQKTVWAVYNKLEATKFKK